MTTLTAPTRMRGRGEAQRFVSQLPEDLGGCMIEIVVPADVLPTASFIDQLVQVILIDRGADHLALRTPSALVADIARSSAASLSVSEQLSVVD